MKRPITALAISALLTLTATACSQGGDSGGTAPKEGNSSHPLQTYLVDIYRTFQGSIADQVTLQKNAATCMKKLGFTYVPHTEKSLAEQEKMQLKFLQTEQTDEQFLTQAKKSGYGIFTDQSLLMGGQTKESQAIEQKNQDYQSTLSPDASTKFSEALYGKDSAGGGCLDNPLLKKAFKEPPARIKTLFEDITNLQTEITKKPEMRKLSKKWSECVEAKGLGKFTDFAEPVQSLFGADAGADPTALSDDARKAMAKKEIALATGDAECKLKFGYIKTQNSLSKIAENDFINSHKSELAELKKFLH